MPQSDGGDPRPESLPHVATQIQNLASVQTLHAANDSLDELAIEAVLEEARKVRQTKDPTTPADAALLSVADALQASLDLRLRITAQFDALTLPTLLDDPMISDQTGTVGQCAFGTVVGADAKFSQADLVDISRAQLAAAAFPPSSQRRRPPHEIGSDNPGPLFRPPCRVD